MELGNTCAHMSWREMLDHDHDEKRKDFAATATVPMPLLLLLASWPEF